MLREGGELLRNCEKCLVSGRNSEKLREMFGEGGEIMRHGEKWLIRGRNCEKW